jgi:hypothetical protein
VGLGVVELFHQLKSRRLIRVVILQSEGFQTGKVRDHNQGLLHSFVSV